VSGEQLTYDGRVLYGAGDGASSYELHPIPPRPTTVLTMGTFSLFHSGHVFLFQQCRKLAGPGGKVVVSVNSDDFAGRFKDRPPQTLHERMVIIASCRYVDDVIENTGNEDAKVVIEQVWPDYLVIGQDWAQYQKDYYAQLAVTQDYLNERGISLLYVPRPPGSISSTEVKDRVRKSGTR